MATDQQAIFLLSHMRASTSLAGHILGSHPQINGYYEMHSSYADAAALAAQVKRYAENDPIKANSRYIFDKLLHNDYTVALAEPVFSTSKVLVSLAKPERTIKSIIHLFGAKDSAEPYASPVAATAYYVQRLQALADFCQAYPQRYYYYDAELFQTAPQLLLTRLSSWLELASPLTERYEIFSQTGKAGKGDSSALIQSGKIESSKQDYAHVLLAENLLSQAVETYQSSRQVMIAHAREVIVS